MDDLNVKKSTKLILNVNTRFKNQVGLLLNFPINICYIVGHDVIKENPQL